MGCFNSKSASEKPRKSLKTTRKHVAAQNKKKTDATASINADIASVSDTEKTLGPEDSAVINIHNSQHSTEKFLRSVLGDAESFFKSLPDTNAVKQIIALTFMNSCVEVTRTKFRLKVDAVIAILRKLTTALKATLLESSLEHVEERSMDDSFFRILIAWYSNNLSFAKRISAEAGQNILDALYIRLVNNKPVVFKDILAFQFQWVSRNQAALEVFLKFSDGKDAMSIEQLGRFLREMQRIGITDKQITEKYKYRFGGGVHQYNFASYNGGVLSNNAIDPVRTSDVWQDMTQSFTHYMVACARIETENDLQRAMNESIRALVLNIEKGKDGKVYSGRCPLQTVVEYVKKYGFTTNTYPIVLCLSSTSDFTVSLQDEVAAILNNSLGSLLAKGLMFEGAVISDPKFSPGALRKKVLVMSSQCALKPFIGFYVVNMHKDGIGVRVTDVVEATPAEKGGILKDDWLTHIDNTPIHNKQHLRQCLAHLKVGEEFVVRRENLDEIKIVVGGIVDSDDTSASRDLSAITFFKFTMGADPKPWDIEILDAAKLLSDGQLDRKQYLDHFAFVRINASSDDMPDCEGIAASKGVQFIDVDNSERCLAWAQAYFSDNGHCGYLLKTDADTDKASSDLIINVIAGPRALGCPPLSGMKARIHGNGSVRQSGTELTFSGYDGRTIAVVYMTFDPNGVEHTYTVYFSPSLIRSGYRAMPSFSSGEERSPQKQINGIYVFAKR